MNTIRLITHMVLVIVYILLYVIFDDFDSMLLQKLNEMTHQFYRTIGNELGDFKIVQLCHPKPNLNNANSFLLSTS